MSREGAIAVHRFGLGARPGEIDAASAAPKSWLIDQLDGAAPQPHPLDDGDPFKSAAELVRDESGLRRMSAQQRQLLMPVKMERQIFLREMAARFALGFTTPKPFAERLVWFWSNHFSVATQNGAAAFAGAFEREAIRPHVGGRFDDMLLAVVRHPAMLRYLNNAQSIGPHSSAGLRNGKGLNENLGRELMELHTLGVNGGYTQADVIAMAKLLTGWSLDFDGRGDGSGFRFYPGRHEPGVISLRGKTYPAGEEGGIAALADLARDPATARHIGQKFATHFIAADPPPDAIARFEKVFLQTGGDLRALAQAAVDDPAAWARSPGKMRSPVEYVTAAMRALGWPHDGDRDKQVRGAMAATRLMGEFPLSAPSPKGWPDDSAAWSGPDAVLNRVEWAHEVGGRIPLHVDALAIAGASLGPLLRSATRAAMKAVGSPGDAVALLLASAEFQRR